MKHSFKKFGNILSVLLILNSFLFINPCKAQGIKQEIGLLYKISGNGLEKPSYLFGTIHLICAEDIEITDTFKHCFKESEQIALELDLDDPNTLIEAQKALMLPEGKTICDLIDKKLCKKLTKFLANKNIDIEDVEKLNPFAIISQLSSQMFDCEVGSYELTFMQMAMAESKQIHGLEAVEAQLAAINAIPFEKQIEMILEESSGNDEDLQMMINAYKAKNLDQLYMIISEMGSEFMMFEDEFVFQRNRNWIPVIEKMIKEKSTFIAVGAGHLPTNQGLIHLLRKAGYSVEVVE